MNKIDFKFVGLYNTRTMAPCEIYRIEPGEENIQISVLPGDNQDMHVIIPFVNGDARCELDDNSSNALIEGDPKYVIVGRTKGETVLPDIVDLSARHILREGEGLVISCPEFYNESYRIFHKKRQPLRGIGPIIGRDPQPT